MRGVDLVKVTLWQGIVCWINRWTFTKNMLYAASISAAPVTQDKLIKCWRLIKVLGSRVNILQYTNEDEKWLIELTEWKCWVGGGAFHWQRTGLGVGGFCAQSSIAQSSARINQLSRKLSRNSVSRKRKLASVWILILPNASAARVVDICLPTHPEWKLVETSNFEEIFFLCSRGKLLISIDFWKRLFFKPNTHRCSGRLKK